MLAALATKKPQSGQSKAWNLQVTRCSLTPRQFVQRFKSLVRRRSIGPGGRVVRQVIEVTLFTCRSSVTWHSRRFDTAKDSTEMACERDHHQREQSHCEISDTRRKTFRAEARAHPGENEDEQSGSKRADHMQP